MSDFFTIGNPPIEIYLRKNSQAKRYSLRISNKDNKVSLTLPRWSNLREAREFAQSQEGWMRKHLAQQSKANYRALWTAYIIGWKKNSYSTWK